VKELIQQELNAQMLAAELNRLLNDEQTINAVQKDYDQLWSILGAGGASERAAKLIVKDVSSG
jgi:lipid A disaccharide synthetase